MKKYEHNYGKNPEGVLSTTSGYATETTNFGEAAFGILNKSTRDKNNFTTPEVVSSSTATLFSVGNGTDHDSRKNIIELKADGTVYISGVGQYDGTNPGEATDIADEFQGIHDDITGLNEDVDRIDNTIESIHISEDSVQDQIKTALEDYLPLTGGTLTGSLIVNGLVYSNRGFMNDDFQLESNIHGAEIFLQSLVQDGPDTDILAIWNSYNNKIFGFSSTGISMLNGRDNKLFNTAGGTTTIDSIREGLATEDALNEYKTSNDAEITALKSKDTELSNKIDSIHIPSKVSELENDSKYQTEDQVNSRIQAVVGAAPEALDTLKEIGDALGNDPDFAATMANKLTEINSKIGSNTYTGANYISKETNLTDAVVQLDEEIKATNDNLALEHANAEAAYAKKTDVPTNVSQLTNDAGYQTEAQVAAKVASLVDSAPETLNTLNKLAAALGDDANFATTVTNQIAQKADKTTATTSADGLMSAADKAKLDSVATEEDIQALFN